MSASVLWRHSDTRAASQHTRSTHRALVAGREGRRTQGRGWDGRLRGLRRCLPDGRDQLFTGLMLANEPRTARVSGARPRRRIIEHRQHHHCDSWLARRHRRRGVETVERRAHPDIHEKDVGLQRAGKAHSRITVPGFAHNFHIRFELQLHPEAPPDGGLVVGDEKANAIRGHVQSRLDWAARGVGPRVWVAFRLLAE